MAIAVVYGPMRQPDLTSPANVYSTPSTVLRTSRPAPPLDLRCASALAPALREPTPHPTFNLGHATLGKFCFALTPKLISHSLVSLSPLSLSLSLSCSCPAGKTADAGSKAAADCNVCSEGYTGPDGVSATCSVCADGTFKSATGDATCEEYVF